MKLQQHKNASQGAFFILANRSELQTGVRFVQDGIGLFEYFQPAKTMMIKFTAATTRLRRHLPRSHRA